MFPVVSAGAAAVPWPLPAVAEFVPQAIFRKEAAPLVVLLIEEMSLRVMSGWDIEVGLTGTDSGYPCFAGRVCGRVCRGGCCAVAHAGSR